MKKGFFAPLALLMGATLVLSACEKKDVNSGDAPPTAQTRQNAIGTGQQITWEEAKAWTATYQEAHPAGVRSSYYASDVFKKLLSQSEVSGIRIYNATSETGDCLVLVGATESKDFTGGAYRLYDKGLSCPNSCGSSELNHGSSSAGPVSATTGEVITFAQANAWIKAYQLAHPESMKSSFYNADVFYSLLSQPTATGIRIYNATKSDGDCYVLVGATVSSDLTGEQYQAFDMATPCPGVCQYDSELPH